MSVIFDLETGALPDDQLAAMIPKFDAEAAVPHPGKFDPASVALGNVKDQAKIDAKLDAAREKHGQLVASVADRRIAAYDAHKAEFVARAALSPLTGCVKAIGMWDRELDAIQTVHAEATGFNCEADVIDYFWKSWAGSQQLFVGHNIHGFDLPFLLRRSWLLNITVPEGILQNNRYWAPRFIDTMVMWGCGSRDFVKLDVLDRAIGGPGKPDDCTGADFARMYDAGGEERETAIAYLTNDLRMTGRVADAMGIY